jgi:hypothetical protein
MAEEPQEQFDTGVATDFPKVKTPDQSDIPHHPAADPTQSNPYRKETEESESESK